MNHNYIYFSFILFAIISCSELDGEQTLCNEDFNKAREFLVSDNVKKILDATRSEDIVHENLFFAKKEAEGIYEKYDSCFTKNILNYPTKERRDVDKRILVLLIELRGALRYVSSGKESLEEFHSYIQASGIDELRSLLDIEKEG